jgi:hypothetical protein
MNSAHGKIDRRRKPVLIIECDSIQLTRDNLAFGDELHLRLKQVFPHNNISLVHADTEASLLKQLGTLAESGKPYKDIVIIGHSNPTGLQMTSDRFSQWRDVANWLSPFAPQRIALLACNAGRWLPCAALFDGVPSLKEIIGSPVLAYGDQLYFVLLTVLHKLWAKKPNREVIKLMQIGNFVITKGLMFSNTRRDYERGGIVDGAFWTFAEPIINEFAERLRHNFN